MRYDTYGILLHIQSRYLSTGCGIAFPRCTYCYTITNYSVHSVYNVVNVCISYINSRPVLDLSFYVQNTVYVIKNASEKKNMGSNSCKHSVLQATYNVQSQGSHEISSLFGLVYITCSYKYKTYRKIVFPQCPVVIFKLCNAKQPQEIYFQYVYKHVLPFLGSKINNICIHSNMSTMWL